MYRDNSLIPSEAVRLLALGVLASGERCYGELAGEVRHFTSHLVGPSLDLVAPPLELLRVEGLIEAAEPSDLGDQTLLRVTEAGRAALTTLLTANVRAPVNDLNKLILTLKMRFLHLLTSAEQKLQLEVLIEMSERELLRLTELRAHHAADAGHLSEWLDHGTTETAARLAWLSDLLARLG